MSEKVTYSILNVQFKMYNLKAYLPKITSAQQDDGLSANLHKEEKDIRELH